MNTAHQGLLRLSHFTDQTIFMVFMVASLNIEVAFKSRQRLYSSMDDSTVSRTNEVWIGMECRIMLIIDKVLTFRVHCSLYLRSARKSLRYSYHEVSTTEWPSESAT